MLRETLFLAEMEDHAEIVDVDGSGERKSLANLEESLGGGGEGAQEAASNSPAHSASRLASPIIECVSRVYVDERAACSVRMPVVAVTVFMQLRGP